MAAGLNADSCGCVDYEPVDPDDTLTLECVCGHVVDEHERTGFFRRCHFNTDEEE